MEQIPECQLCQQQSPYPLLLQKFQGYTPARRVSSGPNFDPARWLIQPGINLKKIFFIKSKITSVLPKNVFMTVLST